LKILALPATEVADLIVAQFYLLIAWATVRLRRRGDLLRTVSPNGPRSTRQDVGRLARVALAVDRVSRFGIIHPTCLVRAIALERMIHRVDAGPAVVRVGVLPGGQTLAAHAWIELDGRVVGDEPSFIRRFVPLSDFSAMRK
jgi:hypothetical protein